MAWKAKQASDVRRARRRHVVEMLHMAKRPFASVPVLLGMKLILFDCCKIVTFSVNMRKLLL